MIKKITDKLIYIGVDDTDIDLFENQYPVPDGMSYNSYLLLGEKIAVMDTADARKGDEWLANLEEGLAGRTPDYLVVQHMEPDHSALIDEVVKRYPAVTIVTTAKAQKMLQNFFAEMPAAEIRTVGEGDTIGLGGLTLCFTLAPMVHWPEVMMTYVPEIKTIFSADGFGKFGALSKCGFTDAEDDDWACEARRYYFNICGKYGAPVQCVLKKLAALDVERICALHGPVLQNDLAQYIKLYDIWSSYGTESAGVVLLYASIHGGTAAVADKVREMLIEKGCPKVVVFDLCRSDVSEVLEDVFRYGRLVLAASSYDAGVFPPMHDLLYHMKIKACQNKRVALIENGSWAPTAAAAMKEMLASMKNMEIVEPVVTIMSRMKPSDIPALDKLTDAILA
ncbi:MAG: FprA family A-type flavoprotein [Bacteroidales bacterium]|nr:FprA family A-type flavoprotein [Bacteroidales bacterium]